MKLKPVWELIKSLTVALSMFYVPPALLPNTHTVGPFCIWLNARPLELYAILKLCLPSTCPSSQTLFGGLYGESVDWSSWAVSNSERWKPQPSSHTKREVWLWCGQRQRTYMQTHRYTCRHGAEPRCSSLVSSAHYVLSQSVGKAHPLPKSPSPCIYTKSEGAYVYSL